MRLGDWLRKFLVFVITFAGMLAVMRVESPSEGPRRAWKRADFRQKITIKKIYQAAAIATGLRKPTIKEQLRDVMAGDELASQNPFANLGADDALEQIFKSDIKTFERQTMRSPAYHDEAGYDLVHYEILNKNGSASSVVAFVDSDVVVVMIITPKGDKNELAVFRDSTLEEINLIMPEEGEALLAQRLDSGIPFLSVAR